MTASKTAAPTAVVAYFNAAIMYNITNFQALTNKSITTRFPSSKYLSFDDYVRNVDNKAGERSKIITADPETSKLLDDFLRAINTFVSSGICPEDKDKNLEELAIRYIGMPALLNGCLKRLQRLPDRFANSASDYITHLTDFVTKMGTVSQPMERKTSNSRQNNSSINSNLLSECADAACRLVFELSVYAAAYLINLTGATPKVSLSIAKTGLFMIAIERLYVPIDDVYICFTCFGVSIEEKVIEKKAPSKPRATPKGAQQEMLNRPSIIDDEDVPRRVSDRTLRTSQRDQGLQRDSRDDYSNYQDNVDEMN